MEIAALVSLGISFFIALSASWFLLHPFFGEKEVMTASEAREDRLRDLAEQKEVLVTSLEELEQDFFHGKVSKEDYLSLKKDLTEQAASCLLELDTSNEKVRGNA